MLQSQVRSIHLIIKSSLSFGSNLFNFIILIRLWGLLNKFTCWPLMQKVTHSNYSWFEIYFRFHDSRSISLGFSLLFNFPSRYFSLSLLSSFYIFFFLLFIEIHTESPFDLELYLEISFIITFSIYYHILRYLNSMTFLLTFLGMDIGWGAKPDVTHLRLWHLPFT